MDAGKPWVYVILTIRAFLNIRITLRKRQVPIQLVPFPQGKRQPPQDPKSDGSACKCASFIDLAFISKGAGISMPCLPRVPYVDFCSD
ncbi:hypothetical protein CBM2592_B110033 [Cupriavidus taiwanensis]|nr:hypothetical protein CBM2588_B140027 [Cupriavidus taiwanensis]SOY63493.1 hypothetical protein CBM2592_B110033 [Cupriavidus taiwanensis]SOY93699.1 hypothetical protein CBM2591_B100006 [Cupriavidus taiwanensis]SOZ85358.1 hypothetical protein CBM2618_B130119 [Cupriavidus taiwanensis]SOZ94015.1 hypothetical protein CBM2621_B140122 [Cupriavidus taiwanensis]